ncbi:uncharacterized protein LOC130899259 isoform X2 [Diorhabda carinulata]|uniref:uncharacterized protein LOC130899259 isoform X2 n=1 Tax=Diorhabda carinulata TaxID=1163345 RepID=UPI0025A160C5|nr:uncharacterized protein LOC130899259 isoform X2 [Diorhabda carinulata]
MIIMNRIPAASDKMRSDVKYEKLPTITTSKSVNSYINYRKNVDNKLAEINNNISEMLIESFKGIDSICTKVRECVSDFSHEQISSRYRESDLHKSNDTFQNVDDGMTENLLESIHEDTEKSMKIEEIEDEEQEETRSGTASAYLIESFISSDEACSKERVIEIGEPNLLKEKTKPLLPKFITVVGDGNSTQRNEDSVKKIVARKRTNRNEKRRKLLDNLRDSLKLYVEKTDFHSLQTLIENVTEQIDVLGDLSMGDNQFELKKKYKTIKMKDQEDKSPHSELNGSVDKPKCSIEIPEVYHRPGVTNIHRRLLWQIEANDSFTTFQKLMRKQEKNKTGKIDSPITQINIPILTDTPTCLSQQTKRLTKKNIKEEDGANGDSRFKYSDSLWFNGKKLFKMSKVQKVKKKDRKEKIKNVKSKTKKRAAINQEQKPTSTTGCGCSVKVTNNNPVVQNYCSGRHPRTHVQVSRKKLAYLDILDDLTNRDLLPLHSEYPRKDHLNVCQDRNSKEIHDSYLYKIMYEKNTGIWNHLIQPTIECRDSSCAFCIHSKNKSKKQIPIKSTNEKRKMTSKVPPVDKTTSVIAKRKRIMKTLAPYMFDPDFERNGNFQSLVVMPVRLFYDKDNASDIDTNSNNIKNSIVPLTPLPLKEVKVNRAKWVNPANVKKTGFKLFLEDPKDAQDAYRKTNKNLEKAMVKQTTGIEGKTKINMFVNRFNNVQSKGDFQLKTLHKSGNNLGKQQMDAFKNRSEILDGNREVMKKCNNVLFQKNKFQPTKIQNKSEKCDFPTKHKQMLFHLKGLKQKNDHIQSNIQKAIGVIETKMVDVLSSPYKTASAEAFDIMEKEINNVLDLMKNQCKDKLPPVHEISPIDSFRGETMSIDSPTCIDSTVKTTLNDSPVDKTIDSYNNETLIDSPVKKKLIDSHIKKKLIDSSVQKTCIDSPTNKKSIDSPNKKTNNASVKKTCIDSPVKKTLIDVKTECIDSALRPPIIDSIDKETPIIDSADKEVRIDSSVNEKIIDFTGKDIDSNEREGSSKKCNYLTRDKLKSTRDRKVSEKPTRPKPIDCSQESEKSLLQKLSICKSVETTSYQYLSQLENETNQISNDVLETELNVISTDLIAKLENILYKDGHKDNYTSDTTKFKQKYSAINKVDKIHSSSETLLSMDEVFQKNTVESTTISKSQISVIGKKIKNKNSNTDFSSILVETGFAAGEKAAKEDNCVNEIKETGEIGDCITQEKAIDKNKEKKNAGLNLDDYKIKSDHFMSTSIDCEQSTTKIDVKSSIRKILPGKKKISKTTVSKKEFMDSDDDKIDETYDKNDNLEAQVNKIISRVEDIYSQLDEIQVTTKENSTIPIFREYSSIEQKIPSQEFLPPFLDAVKRSKKITKSSNELVKSASYYNILKFLDSLTDIHTDTAIEIHKTTELCYASSVPTTVHFISMDHRATLGDDVKELTEKPSCLKKHSGDVCKCAKPKRVSFSIKNQPEITELDRGDNPNKSNNIVVICDKRETIDVSTDTNRNNESINIDNSIELTESTSDVSLATAQSTPKIKVFYDEKEEEILSEGFYNDKSIIRRNENRNDKPKVVIFREIDLSKLIRRPKYLQKFTNTSDIISANRFLLTKHSVDENNVFLLNSFYAIVYLLMFAAFNMEYNCF